MTGWTRAAQEKRSPEPEGIGTNRRESEGIQNRNYMPRPGPAQAGPGRGEIVGAELEESRSMRTSARRPLFVARAICPQCPFRSLWAVPWRTMCAATRGIARREDPSTGLEAGPLPKDAGCDSSAAATGNEIHHSPPDCCAPASRGGFTGDGGRLRAVPTEAAARVWPPYGGAATVGTALCRPRLRFRTALDLPAANALVPSAGRLISAPTAGRRHFAVRGCVSAGA